MVKLQAASDLDGVKGLENQTTPSREGQGCLMFSGSFLKEPTDYDSVVLLSFGEA